MEALGIDIKLLIAQIVNFAIFFFIFSKFIAKPFLAYIQKEKDKETEKQRLLSSLQTEETALLEKKDKVLKEANQQARTLLAEAKDLAEKSREEILANAQKEVDAIKTKGEMQLVSEKEEMYRDVKKYIAETSASMTKQVLKDVLSADDQKKILVALEKKIVN